MFGASADTVSGAVDGVLGPATDVINPGTRAQIWASSLGGERSDPMPGREGANRAVRSRKTGAMARMNRNRRGGGDDDFGAVGEEPTFAARYAGTCATCGKRFAVGDPIASLVVDKKSTYHHAACRYPATAFLSSHDPDVGTAMDTGLDSPDRCKATTKKGAPCSNAPQKGEQYCGPHLTRQQNSRS